MIRYKGIHHTALVTGDLDATIRFWRDLLGLRLVGGLGSRGYHQYFFAISDNNFLAFFSWEGAQPVPEKEAGRAVAGPVGFDHICLEVADADQLWLVKDRLDAAAKWASELIDNGFIHSIFTFDPNGIAVELCYRVPHEDLRESPRLVDTAPAQTALEGSEPVSDRWPRVKTPTPREDRPIYPGELGKLLEGDNRWADPGDDTIDDGA